LIPFTAAADAEFILHGAARCIAGVPSNPLGPPGPALITRAALGLAAIPAIVVDAGTRIRPDCPTTLLGTTPGGAIDDPGDAVPEAVALFARGFDLGRGLAAEADYLVIGESVPGGTTTALALLLALEVDARGRVSGSLAGNAHRLKTQVAERALSHLAANTPRDPLAAVRALGDPMQPAVAGMALGAASRECPVLLAGGTQMAAVAALTARIAAIEQLPWPDAAVVTTRWVVEDPSADLIGLLHQIGPIPLLSTTLSFAQSRFPALRRYEDFLVKEGVGAGGATVAAHLAAHISAAEVARAVDAAYAEMLLA
jgi:uncharacterized protein (TIGR00303 family)